MPYGDTVRLSSYLIAKTHKLVGGDNRYKIHIRKYRDQLAVPADREGKPTPQQFCGFHEPGKVPSGLDNGLILDSLSRARACQLPALNNHGRRSGPSHLDTSLPEPCAVAIGHH
jgi:hypothetical protein